MNDTKYRWLDRADKIDKEIIRLQEQINGHDCQLSRDDGCTCNQKRMRLKSLMYDRQEIKIHMNI